MESDVFHEKLFFKNIFVEIKVYYNTKSSSLSVIYQTKQNDQTIFQFLKGNNCNNLELSLNPAIDGFIGARDFTGDCICNPKHVDLKINSAIDDLMEPCFL